MEEINFSITINISMNFERNKASFSIKDVELKPTMMSLPFSLLTEAGEKEEEKGERKTIHYIILETAWKIISEENKEIFTAADLFRLAKGKYPDLKKNSFNAHVIAAAPNHKSWKHFANKKDYLIYLGKGKYKLKKE